MEKSLEEKVEELWSREQIKSLTYAYGECIVRRDAEAMGNLFVPEAVIDFTQLGAGVHRGREAIKKFYETTWPARVKPFFSNHYIDFIDKARARGWCWVDNRAVRGESSLIGCGKIYDEYRALEGQWRFASRRVVMLFMVLLSEGWARQVEDSKLSEPRWVGNI
jgi:SnoaL-like protein